MCWCPTVSPKIDTTPGLAPRGIRRVLPRGLFGRSLIIIVAPMVLLLGIFTYVFFERDLDMTTRRLARDVAADVVYLIALEDSAPQKYRAAARVVASDMLRYKLRFDPGAVIPPPSSEPHSTIDEALDEVIMQQIGPQRHFTTARVGNSFDIAVQVHDGVLHVLVPRDRATVSQPDIFILWMVGSALMLLGVAIVFLRNQVRPIERLAFASESFGKGRTVPDFKPYGATEVRRAAQAFLTMRERIERHVSQRTEMLAGVSHDLKTPLTRMKLALALMPPGADIEALREDIEEMEHMLDEYLNFARGEGGEESLTAQIAELVRDTASAAARARDVPSGNLTVIAPEGIALPVKRNALRRCLTNLVDNAFKHGRQVAVTVQRDEHYAEIIVEDDGPGIPETRREEAFRPFHRLDQGRNLQTGGSGLGLAIARDIARAHGGDIILDQSKLGGLKATIRLPV